MQAAALQGLVSLAGVPYPLATALAVEAAILHNFLWHERWTWGDRLQAGLKTRSHTGPTRSHTGQTRSHTGPTRSHTGPTRSHTGTTHSHTGETRRHTGRLARFLRFNSATALVSIGGNVALMSLLVGGLHLPLLAAMTLAVAAMSLANFTCADRFVFTD